MLKDNDLEFANSITEGFKTITGFPASIGACPSLGDDHPRFLLLPTGSRSQYGETARVDEMPCVIKQHAGSDQDVLE